MSTSNKKVGFAAYFSLLFAIIFFSGIMTTDLLKKHVLTTPKTQAIASVFDFNTLNGKFGTMMTSVMMGEDQTIQTKSSNFTGENGTGARQGFMFALSLIPTVMFALGMIAVIEFFGALEAMRVLLTRLLRPMLGIPGVCGLGMIAGFQSTDSGGAMTRNLYDEGKITEKEKNIFSMFQFSAGATISNFLSSGAPLIAIMSVTGEKVPTSLGVCIGVMLVMKVFGANLFRLYINIAERKNKE